MPSIKELRAIPGESRLLTGYLDEVVIQAPTEKDLEKGRKAKEPYVPKTKYYFLFSPNQLEARKVNFDPEKFKPEQLQTLEAAFCAVECEVRPWKMVGDDGVERSGETTVLVKLRNIYRDSNGDEPKRQQ